MVRTVGPVESGALMPVRIVIADDHEVVRLGLRAVLEREPGWTVCGEAATGRQAIAEAVEQRPDVVILDVSMPDINGLEAARQIRRVVAAQILIVSVNESDQMLRDAVDAGASGFVSKADAARTLVEAVRTIVNRQTFFPLPAAAVAGLAVADDRPAGVARPPARGPLTPRESEVLALLAAGRTNKKIAATLGISIKTAETHRARILRKLDLHSMNELVRYALRNHLIEP
jgi:DNA-binding NarL/FixJ family response regulator